MTIIQTHYLHVGMCHNEKEKERRETGVKYSKSSMGIFLCTILIFHLRVNKVSEHALFSS